MASNDGARLAVFGLTFRQHDNRHMQQILRTHGRLPSNPGNRTILFTSIFDLSRDLPDDEIQSIGDWLQNGGVPDDFPVPRPKSPSPVPNSGPDGYRYEDESEESQQAWQEYNPADFEDESAGIVDTHLIEGDEMDFENGLEIPDRDEQSEQIEELFEDGVLFGNSRQEHNVLGDFNGSLADREDSTGGAERPEHECSVCMDVKESADKLAPVKVTATCDHDHDMRTCFHCLEQHITSIISEGCLAYLCCPLCTEKLSAKEIEKYATPGAFAR